MSTISITNLPIEVIETNLFVYLSNKDIRSFGMTGYTLFKDISTNTLQKRYGKPIFYRV